VVSGSTRAASTNTALCRTPADSRRGEGAHATLATVLGYVQARVVEDARRHVPVARESVGPDGLVTDPAVHTGIADAITTLLTAAGR
jgi:hypothetical protein